jgi:UDP-N-acetylmuramate dehydrogenase
MTLSNSMSLTTFTCNETLDSRASSSAVYGVKDVMKKGPNLPGSDCLIRPNVSLTKLTSFQVGGPAEWYVAPRNLADLQGSLAWAQSERLPVTLLGAGSNLLVSDRGLKGLVIGTKHLRQIEFDQSNGQVTVGAGVMLPSLAKQIAGFGWQGFEWAVGIPGTVGGGVVMNAGAHGGSMADILVEAQVLLADGSVQTMTLEDMKYAYRTSILQKMPRFVAQATFQLQPGADPAFVQQATSKCLHQRRDTQPYDMPSCGSVFRNPEPEKAARLIEQAGLKGFRIGGAHVANRHANFILNSGGATATDIFNLIYHVQKVVADRWDLHLEPEVRMLGEFKTAA